MCFLYVKCVGSSIESVCMYVAFILRCVVVEGEGFAYGLIVFLCSLFLPLLSALFN
jgi:hypothetical protein